MLSFDIRALESSAIQIEDDLAASDPVWIDGDLRPESGVHVEGRLSVAGDDRFYFSGRFSGSVKLDCRRCLAEVEVGVSEEVHFLIAPAGDDAAEDDPDVFTYNPGLGELDIRPAVREGWLLQAPTFAQCREDCKGLCPGCGSDLNAGACECESAATDARWEELRKVRGDFPA